MYTSKLKCPADRTAPVKGLNYKGSLTSEDNTDKKIKAAVCKTFVFIAQGKSV